jgi:hypothetical protein
VGGSQFETKIHTINHPMQSTIRGYEFNTVEDRESTLPGLSVPGSLGIVLPGGCLVPLFNNRISEE